MRIRALTLASSVLVFSVLVFGAIGCATPTPAPAPERVPGAPATPSPVSVGERSGNVALGATTAAVEAVDSVRTAKKKEAVETKAAQGMITIDCSVKLPDDPTDNPELCRSFQMELVDETGAEMARFRFGIDARYRFPAKPGKHYRIRPILGKNWEFSVEPNRDLTVGERARIQLRQKE